MDCVDEITNAWNIDVKPETISNCFKKAGFGQYSEWETEDEIPLIYIRERLNERSEDETQLQIEYEAWESIKNTRGVTFNDFIHVDEDIVTSEFPTAADIVEFYRSDSERVQLGNKDNNENDITEDDLEDDLLQPPSNELIVNSLSILRSYLKTNEHTTDFVYNSLNNIETFFENQNKKSFRQSQITDFFTVN